MTKAFAYLRICGPDQPAGDGFPRQAEQVYAYALANNIRVTNEFRDCVQSGTTNPPLQPGLLEALRTAAIEGVKLILVEHPGRLGFGSCSVGLVLAWATEHGIRVVAVDQDEDLGEENVELVKMCSVYRRISKQVLQPLDLRVAYARASRKPGWRGGRRPFGSHPAERQALRRMHQLHRKPRGKPRRSYQKIADILNQEEHSTRSGKPWRRNTVREILRRTRGQRITGDEASG